MSRAAFALVTLLTMLLSPIAVRASEDPRNPSPWPGGGLQWTNRDGRAHTLYYWLSGQTRALSAYDYAIHANARGTGSIVVRLYKESNGADYLRIQAVPPNASTQAEVDGNARVASSRRVILAVRMDAGIRSCSVLVQRRGVPVRIHRPGSSPSPSPGPMADGAPWPAAGASGAIPEGHEPVTYVLTVTGGNVTVTIDTVTSFSSTVTFDVMAPDAPPGAPYSIWTVSNFNGSPDANPHRNVVTETRSLAAGRYEVRLTRESASRASTCTVRVTGAVAP